MKLFFIVLFVILNIWVLNGSDDKQNTSHLKFNKRDQRAIVMSCVRTNVPPTECMERLQICAGEEAFDRSHVYRLYGEFRSGQRISCDRISGSGRPASAVNPDNEQRLRVLFDASREWTLEELAYELGVSYGSTQELVQRIGFRKVASRFVPHELTCAIRSQRVRVAQDNLNRHNADRHLLATRVVSIDETPIRNYQPMDSHSAAQWRANDEPP